MAATVQAFTACCSLIKRGANGAIDHHDLGCVGHDRDIEISCLEPNGTPYDSIPNRNPMKMFKGSDHEGVERK